MRWLGMSMWAALAMAVVLQVVATTTGPGRAWCVCSTALSVAPVEASPCCTAVEKTNHAPPVDQGCDGCHIIPVPDEGTPAQAPVPLALGSWFRPQLAWVGNLRWPVTRAGLPLADPPDRRPPLMRTVVLTC